MTIIYVNNIPLEHALVIVPTLSVLLCCSTLGFVAVCLVCCRHNRRRKMGALLDPLDDEYTEESADVKDVRASRDAPKVRWNAMGPQYMDGSDMEESARNSREFPVSMADISWSRGTGPGRPKSSSTGACIFAESSLDDEPELQSNFYQNIAGVNVNGELVFTV